MAGALALDARVSVAHAQLLIGMRRGIVEIARMKPGYIAAGIR